MTRRPVIPVCDPGRHTGESRYPGFFIVIPVKTGIQNQTGYPRIGYGVNPVSSTGQAYRDPAWHINLDTGSWSGMTYRANHSITSFRWKPESRTSLDSR